MATAYHPHPPRHRARQGEYDARIQEEASLANAIKAAFPQMTRSEALKEATRILDNPRRK